MPTPIYKATVVGGGPAGLAIVANLLDKAIKPILWIDPEFNAGRLSNYLEVPSNTKVKLFIQYCKASKTLAGICEGSCSPTCKLEALVQDSGCELRYAKEMVSCMTKCLEDKYKDQITLVRGFVENIGSFLPIDQLAKIEKGYEENWSIKLKGTDQEEKQFLSEHVFLATGSRPKAHEGLEAIRKELGLELIDLDDALTPSKLRSKINPKDVVAVIGSSHSAVLALKNLAELPNSPKIRNFYRAPFKFAVYMDNWILYDNTGLKGVAADWVRSTLETNSLHNLKRIKLEGNGLEDELYKKELSECTKIIYAIGYERNPIPPIQFPERLVLKNSQISFDNQCGAIIAKLPKCEYLLPKMYGFGIAFPEKTIDPYGNEEDSVGMWKFMRYLQAVFAKLPINA